MPSAKRNNRSALRSPLCGLRFFGLRSAECRDTDGSCRGSGERRLPPPPRHCSKPAPGSYTPPETGSVVMISSEQLPTRAAELLPTLAEATLPPRDSKHPNPAAQFLPTSARVADRNALDLDNRVSRQQRPGFLHESRSA